MPLERNLFIFCFSGAIFCGMSGRTEYESVGCAHAKHCCCQAAAIDYSFVGWMIEI